MARIAGAGRRGADYYLRRQSRAAHPADPDNGSSFFCPNGLVGPNCIVPQLFGGAAAEVADDCFNVACVAARHQMNMIGHNGAGQNTEIRFAARDGETVGD